MWLATLTLSFIAGWTESSLLFGTSLAVPALSLGTAACAWLVAASTRRHLAERTQIALLMKKVSGIAALNVLYILLQTAYDPAAFRTADTVLLYLLNLAGIVTIPHSVEAHHIAVETYSKHRARIAMKRNIMRVNMAHSTKRPRSKTGQNTKPKASAR
ncbi:hypothetical protein L1857_09290 [Amycolatopsis thermalba]|uniref:Uncharacterized protein n=1 Tax=Amycolatopsis thermalba TaxID=944492 RepID=A0ABY4NSE0_9PSEU|nr:MULTISPECIES: hypothetical protein [Amycolatopsis]UQS22996.1 hypothetical protein L1857_09290 [Amycolatopsis thermalba]